MHLIYTTYLICCLALPIMNVRDHWGVKYPLSSQEYLGAIVTVSDEKKDEKKKDEKKKDEKKGGDGHVFGEDRDREFRRYSPPPVSKPSSSSIPEREIYQIPSGGLNPPVIPSKK